MACDDVLLIAVFSVILYPRVSQMISSVWFSPSKFSFQIFVFPIRATCFAHFILLRVLALTSGKEYILGISLLLYFPLLPVTSISSISQYFLQHCFSDAINLCFCLRTKDRFTCSCTTTNKSYNFVYLMSAGSREDGRCWLNGSISSRNVMCCHPPCSYCVLQQGTLPNAYR